MMLAGGILSSMARVQDELSRVNRAFEMKGCVLLATRLAPTRNDYW